jgi:hypothetical protein
VELDRTRAVSAARPARSRSKAALSTLEAEFAATRAVAPVDSTRDLNQPPIAAAEAGASDEPELDSGPAARAALPSELFAQIAGEREPPRPAQARAYVHGPDSRPQGRGKPITV